ncbi:MAG: hypothetical protein BWY72_02135 [Bacteroidetes bacterium ADurb.Bin416]|nr:MAG: hypothetical protein BWY72_02135 [Bacteroidetes bacterium ADurb.Bin416]
MVGLGFFTNPHPEPPPSSTLGPFFDKNHYTLYKMLYMFLYSLYFYYELCIIYIDSKMFLLSYKKP